MTAYEFVAPHTGAHVFDADVGSLLGLRVKGGYSIATACGQRRFAS
jgi:hypothetical protein